MNRQLNSPIVMFVFVALFLPAGCKRNNSPASKNAPSDGNAQSRVASDNEIDHLASAIAFNQNDELRQYLKSGGDPNAEGFGGHLLSVATEQGNLEAMQLLLDAGAKIVWPSVTGATVLDDAAYRGNVPAMDLLIKHGAAISRPHAFATPLEAATQGGHLEAIRYLLKAGADPNEGEGGKALYIACMVGNMEAVQELIQGGAKVNDPRSGEFSPIIAATLGARRGDHWDVMRLLIEKGADPNARNISGKTPLHEAALQHDLENVRFLLAHGARPDLKDGDGNTPEDVALLNKDSTGATSQQVIELLKTGK